MTDSFMGVHRKSLVALTASYKVPAIYYRADFVREGGLISYGIDGNELLRGAARFVDRILREAKASDLPVSLSTKFELAINRRTAAALGLSVPQSCY